jgi:hypothetical protein
MRGRGLTDNSGIGDYETTIGQPPGLPITKSGSPYTNFVESGMCLNGSTGIGRRLAARR